MITKKDDKYPTAMLIQKDILFVGFNDGLISVFNTETFRLVITLLKTNAESLKFGSSLVAVGCWKNVKKFLILNGWLQLATPDLSITYSEMLHPQMEWVWVRALISCIDNGTTFLEEVRKEFNLSIPTLFGSKDTLPYVIIFREDTSLCNYI